MALKFLPADLAHDRQALERFQREARAASALNHPHICTIYDIDEAEGQPFIAMELLEGQALRTRLQGRPLPIPEIVDLGLQLADALEAAHAKGIVHRDTKPANVFITTRGTAKLLDFGLAKLAAEPRQRASEAPTAAGEWVTGAGVALGTVGYMSPEQVRGEALDARSDLFSLGVVLYEMATGTAPFRGATSGAVLGEILTKAPTAPVRINPDVPPELGRIINKALEKDREARYQSAKDLLVDLRRLKRDAESGRAAAGVPPARKGVARRGWAAAAALLLLLLTAALVYLFVGRGQAIDSLAVLPMVNASADASTEYVSDGITESLIDSLSQLPRLKVRARSSVFRYKGRETDPQVVGRELHVQEVLTSRVVQRGDDLSISAELVDARDDTRIWGGQYNRKLADVQGVENEIARAITDKLRLKLTGEQKKSLGRRRTQDSEADQDYLKGRYYWNKRTVPGLRTAIEHFNAAIAKDPTFALAHAGLADSYAVLSSFAPVPPRESLPKAKTAALKALEIDETLGEAYAVLGKVRATFDWDWAGAERDFKRAIELNPSYATAHQWYALHLVQMGRFDESLAEIKGAQELDPLSLVISTQLGRVLLEARRYDQAIGQLRQTLSMDPNFAQAHLVLSEVYALKRMYPEAIAELRAGIESGGRSPAFMTGLGYTYGVGGDEVEARKILAEMLERSRRGYFPAGAIAIVYVGLGDKDRAFQWFEKAVEERGECWFKTDPLYDPLRSDPRFRDALRRLNLAP